MLLGMQDFDFAKIQSNLPKFRTNLINFAYNFFSLHPQLLRHCFCQIFLNFAEI